MKSIAFFNNKGGVGKTSLVFHVGWMFSELGTRVLLVDLDPQANLSSLALPESQLEEMFDAGSARTIQTGVQPLVDGTGDIGPVPPSMLAERLGLLIGDLSLSSFEDALSETWPKCLAGDPRAFRITTAFSRLVGNAASAMAADIALIDVGPNFGAINRAALIAADSVIIPVAPDLFSVQGLENVGERLVEWRREWQQRSNARPNLPFVLPNGQMQPVGYVVGRHSIFAGGRVKAFQRWIERIPYSYRSAVLGEPSPEPIAADQDPHRLGRLKDYRSLMAMAHESNKPMFHLKPADGAIGGHQAAVQECYLDFQQLARRIGSDIGMPSASSS